MDKIYYNINTLCYYVSYPNKLCKLSGNVNNTWKTNII